MSLARWHAALAAATTADEVAAVEFAAMLDADRINVDAMLADLATEKEPPQ